MSETPEVQNMSHKIAEFLTKPVLGRLATASTDGQPHVVPVWFLWEENAVWISSYRSTRKVIDIERNPKCALVVDLENGKDGLAAVMMEGRAELIISPATEVRERIERIYTKYLGSDGLLQNDPQTWLNSPENLLIKLTPTRVKSW